VVVRRCVRAALAGGRTSVGRRHVRPRGRRQKCGHHQARRNACVSQHGPSMAEPSRGRKRLLAQHIARRFT
jgi:hypothetical protein